MERLEYTQLKETVYFKKLSNGLRVYLIPKPEFNKTFATFTTAYGAINSQFTPRNGEHEVTVPHGVAHFLEHKMFEQVDGDVFLEFSQRGASANAYTSLDETCYLFSATDAVYENIETLLNFVQDPYFTDENVEKEKGIIEQEIKMYADNPSSVSYQKMMKLLFPNHPAGIDVAGSVESVHAITKEDLYTCYNTFYHPSNMILVVAGNFELETMMATIEKNQNDKVFDENQTIVQHTVFDTSEIVERIERIKMDVAMSKVRAAIKITKDIQDPIARLKQDFALQFLCELAFSNTSDAYERMMADEVINNSFGTLVNYTEQYGYILFAGDTNKVDDFISELKRTFIDRSYIQAEQLEQIKKRMTGEFLMALNSLEFVANDYAEYAFMGVSLFELPDIIRDITISDVIEAHKTFFANAQLAISVIEPK
ncbi:EF-P 5-aminopentanol modification-associated protein YfmH [Culicoidibacter larvae]|uniref:Insulinase family protein n=1 Tax=Culicoidibacter larvae TaxID=2579976 RepID=A0A5R8QCN2_9FIRM|nr:pitrilysin family protein [Culicoidibacter larvae]TLG74268.1 insulinase family protein [Culicoidibacter larvae]